MKRILIFAILLSLSGIVASKESIIQVGSKVPNFQLVNQDGKEVALDDYKGKGVIISFLYTRCPFPDKCAMIGKKLRNLAELSEKIDKADSLQVLAITIDPARDKPEVLKAYARGFHEKHKNWSFLTGSESEIAKVAGAFGVIYWTEKGVIEHNMRTIFIDPEGNMQYSKSGSDWKVGEFAAEIKPYLK